ncbi:DNA topoisomerase 3-alpha-like [Haliotis cracherodii]|uniref:DNA topoisomerase 3-alpha-like n=1 Tax=Haliotis cracherodii TaxID=6455 RepID=UPI0039E7499F
MFKTFVRFRSNVSEMVRVLNVAEKNDAAKSLADVMSRGGYRKREGFSRFNKIYEFDYRILNQQCTMTMTSVSGHLLGMDFGTQYRKWNSCSPTSLFDLPVFKSCPDNYVDIKRTLEREIKGCRYLVIWTDCDREGENIGFEVIQVCQSVKPNIEIYRARFSEITPHAVNRAISNLQAPDKRVSDAVDVRQELDLRIGAAFTRFQTLRLQKVFPEHLSQQLVSYGSCQFPTLGFVVERYKQVQAFVPEPFWKLKVAHILDDIKADFLWKRNRLFDHLACLVLFEQCIENPIATVLEVKSKNKSKWRPQALDTVEMEKLASRKLRINAKETMKIAEKLYTQGFISYPRTETNIFPKEMDLQSLVQDQTRDPNWGGFAQRILDQGLHPRNGNKTDNAHPPIHPIKYTATLQGNDQRVYEFVVRHFLACCSQDAQGMETTVDINIAEERFTASGLMIIARNYLEVYPYEKWNAKEIPIYKQGDQFEPSSIEMACSETVPPPLLAEADLIALMEKHGIGTDATHAEHIETIKVRSYVGLRPDGRFVPGQLGMGLVEGYDEMGYQMSKPHLRSELEADLQRICEGRKDKNIVLREQIEKYKAVFIEASQQALKLDEALSQYFGQAHALTGAEVTDIAGPAVVRRCPLCGQDMALKAKKDGKGFYIGCMGYPQCRAAIWLPEFVLQADIAEETCPQCGPGPVHLIKFRFRRGSTPPMIPSEHTGCIGGCDHMLTEVLNIQPLAARNNNTSSQANTSLPRRNMNMSDSGYSSSSNTSITSNNTQQRRPQNSNNTQQRRPQNTNSSGNNSTNRGFSTNTNSSYNNSSRNNTSFTGNHRGGNSRPPLTTMPQPNPMAPGGGPGDSGSAIVCNCGTDAMQLTVRKEGPNTG